MWAANAPLGHPGRSLGILLCPPPSLLPLPWWWVEHSLDLFGHLSSIQASPAPRHCTSGLLVVTSGSQRYVFQKKACGQNPCLRALGPWGRRRLLGHGGAQGGAGWLQVWRVQLADKRIKRIRTEKGPRLGGIKTRIGGIETQYMQALRGSYIECSTH